jgi:membrane protein implicated in regulation of membrane protease activity
VAALLKPFREAGAKVAAMFRGASVTSLVARRWLAIGLVTLAALFIALGLWRTWTTAYLVLIGLMPPAKAHAGPVAVLLSLAGYALLPLVIGTAVAGYFTRAVERAGEKDYQAKFQSQLAELVKSGKYAAVPAAGSAPAAHRVDGSAK